MYQAGTSLNLRSSLRAPGTLSHSYQPRLKNTAIYHTAACSRWTLEMAARARSEPQERSKPPFPTSSQSYALLITPALVPTPKPPFPKAGGRDTRHSRKMVAGFREPDRATNETKRNETERTNDTKRNKTKRCDAVRTPAQDRAHAQTKRCPIRSHLEIAARARSEPQERSKWLLEPARSRIGARNGRSVIIIFYSKTGLSRFNRIPVGRPKGRRK